MSGAEDDINALQNRLRFATNIDTVKSNAAAIKEVYDNLRAQLNVVAALRQANQAICPHPKKKHGCDGETWCDDCGWSVG